MRSDPLFTIVIPAYNRAAFIGKTLASVLAQEYKDFEVIVVDDGSTDNTGDVVNSIRDERLRYLRKENGERGAARNFGVAHARGKFINFVDSDDVLYPHHLSVAKKFVDENPLANAFHMAYEVRNTAGELIRRVQPPKEIGRAILGGNMLSTNGVVIRQSVMAANPFNEDRNLAALEDWELWIRLNARFQFQSLKEVTSALIQHPDRSVNTNEVERIARKVEVFCTYVMADGINQRTFGKLLSRALASAKTYAALHIAMSGTNGRMAIDYWRRGISDNPMEIFKKRFIVTGLLLLGLKRVG